MALQSSGAISMSQIRNEWGSSYSLGSYYRGSLPSGRTNYGSIPYSGAISFSNFYGSNAAVAGWTSTLTIGQFTIGKNTSTGFTAGLYGAMSDVTINNWGNRQIRSLNWNGTTANLQVIGNQPNSGWTRIKIHNTNFYRSSATYSYSTYSNWQWATTTNPFAATSGTRTIAFFI